MNDYATKEHLGGCIVGGDEATYFPDLWRWLVEGPLHVKSVLDVGCGEGHALKYFKKLGVEVSGIDGLKQKMRAIRQHDFEQGPLPWKPVDLIWTCEFAEHVVEEKVPNIIPTLQAGKVLLMTHAFPGQQGYHHVNCRESEYWKGFMVAAGFTFSPGLTQKAKEYAAINQNPYNHFLRSGMAFRRTNV